MQINLTGFLNKDAPTFMQELWKLLLECQETDSGVPRSLIEEWKTKNRNVRQNDVRAVEERDRRQRLDEIRSNERDNRRGRGGGRGRGRGRGVPPLRPSGLVLARRGGGECAGPDRRVGAPADGFHTTARAATRRTVTDRRVIYSRGDAQREAPGMDAGKRHVSDAHSHGN